MLQLIENYSFTSLTFALHGAKVLVVFSQFSLLGGIRCELSDSQHCLQVIYILSPGTVYKYTVSSGTAYKYTLILNTVH